jgi:hypothetical protein
MAPFESATSETAVALAEPGRVYVIYLPRGGKVAVDLSDAKGLLTACWFNPRDGKRHEPFDVTGGRTDFQAPDGFDWVLHITRKGEL